MSDVMDELRALDPERDGSSGAPPLGWLRALLDTEPDPPRRRGPFARRGRSPRRRPIAVAVALACLAALAAVAIAVLGGSSPDPRRDALVPANGPVIVHVVARTTNGEPGGRRGGATMGRIGTLDGPVERWVVSPDRWRQRNTLLPSKGLPGGWIDTAYDAGIVRTRDSSRRRERRQRMPSPGARIEPALILAGPIGPHSNELLTGVADPQATIEAMVRDGEVSSLGETVRFGRRLVRLFGERPAVRSGPNSVTPGTQVTWFVDAETHVPVEMTSRFDLGFTRRPAYKPGNRTVFEVYETLPLNAETAPLLNLGGPTR